MNALAQAAPAYEPSPVYLQFLDFYRGQTFSSQDPFAIIFPKRELEGYVPRIGVTEKIFGSSHTVITGLSGAGKATLCANASYLGYPTRLVVTLPDFEAELPLSRSRFAEDLAAQIVSCFWNEINKYDQYRHCLSEEVLERSGNWEQSLCGIYQNFPPEASRSDLRELDGYLRSWFARQPLCPLTDPLTSLASLIQGPQISGSAPSDLHQLRRRIETAFSLDELKTVCVDLHINEDSVNDSTLETYARELIEYCQRRMRIPDLLRELSSQRPQYSWSEFSSAVPWPFDGIRLVIDFANRMSWSHQLELVKEMLDLLPSGLLMTVFAPGSVDFESGIHQLQLFTEFKLDLCRLPMWTEDELQKLVLQRGYQGLVGEPELLLSKLGNNIILRRVRKKLAKIIARSATRGYSLHDPVDAPVHALNLARLAVTTCAEKWRTTPPEYDDGGIDEAHLWQLCDRYWSEWRGN